MSAGLADGENPPPPLFLPTVYEGTCGRQRLGEPSWRPPLLGHPLRGLAFGSGDISQTPSKPQGGFKAALIFDN